MHNENDKENFANANDQSLAHQQYFNRTRVLHCKNEVRSLIFFLYYLIILKEKVCDELSLIILHQNERTFI